MTVINMNELRIRSAVPGDLDRVEEIEAICFPKEEAASRTALKERIETFTKSFFLAEMDGKIIGFINGCETNSPVIYDELYHSTSHHIPGGENLAVFGLDVIPDYRGQGIAAELMKYFIEAARIDGKKGLILTCKYKLVRYYEALGYVNNGLSASSHGGAEWFNMTLRVTGS